MFMEMVCGSALEIVTFFHSISEIMNDDDEEPPAESATVEKKEGDLQPSDSAPPRTTPPIPASS